MRRLTNSGVVCLASLIAAPALADAPLRLNEIRLEQPGADTDEYIEIAGTAGESLNGVAIVVIGNDDFALPGQQSGYVEEVIPLDGFSVKPTGFFVVGEPKLSLTVPDLARSLNLEGGHNVTYLLVRGFTGVIGQKLDTNDDGTLDVTPWTSVVSSVAVVQTPVPNGINDCYFYSTTKVGPDAGLLPSAVWLCLNTPQWVVGTQDPYAGVDSPGLANQSCVPQGVIINEVRIDQAGTDNNEFFELKGAAGQSLDGYSYIVIGDGTAAQGSGVIESITSLNGFVIQSDGLAAIGESTFAGTPGFGTVDYVVSGTNQLNFENSDNVTHLLVKNFTGTSGQDLDTNDDGVLDVTPWSEIADSVAVLNTAATGTQELVYSTTRVGPDGTFWPGHVYRCSPTGAWLIGPFGNTGQVILDSAGATNPACTTCGPGAASCHVVHATPGCVDTNCCNLVCTADPTCCSQDWDQACVNLARQFCLVAGSPPALTLNEIRLDEPSTTDPNEYIEIKGGPGTNLNGVSLVVIGDGSDLNGIAETIVPLSGAIPKDGHFLLAKSTFTLGTPDLVKSFNLENGNTVTYFLVWNWTGLPNLDYDVNNDGILDSQPWDATIDSVGIKAGDGRLVYSANTVGPDYAGLPAHIVKCSTGQWRFGRFNPAATDGFGTPGTPNTVCPPAYACGNPKAPSCYAPHTPPGCSDENCCRSVCVIDITCCELTWDADCANQATLNCFVPSNPPDVKISEIRIDQTSFDVDEYIELVGQPNTLLNGLTYIVIGDGSATQGSGVIEYVQSFQGFRIPQDGFFLATAGSSTQFAAVRDTTLNLPQDNFENGDNVTHMLVWGFTGALGQDLDTNDDGTLDVTPWSTVLTQVALIQSAATPPVGTEYAYGTVRVGPDAGGFVPSQVAYCPSTNTWTIGTFAVNSATVDSPGIANWGCVYSGPPCPADLDGDRVVGASDLAALLGAWGSTGAADLDGDGAVGASDLAAMLAAWGACP